jgi:hypothetical protein
LLLLVEVDDEVKIPEKGRRKLKEQKKKKGQSKYLTNELWLEEIASEIATRRRMGGGKDPRVKSTQPKLQKKQIIQNKKVKM